MFKTNYKLVETEYHRDEINKSNKLFVRIHIY